MANIHFIGGEKGGVGKSLVARVLAQYLIDRGLPFLGFDTDRSHGALMRFYAGYASPVLLDRYETLDAIVEAAVDQPERRILVDLAAQTHDPLVKWMEESGVLDLAEESAFVIHYWHVMDAGKDSVDLLKRLLDRFGSRLNYVLVLNQIRGDDFSILHQSGEHARARGLGARVVSFRHLHDAVINKIDATSSSFWAAQNAADKAATGLGMMERQRVKTWMRDTYQQLDAVQV
jgi:CobQ/CobB/MinD/ParA nucleotide binding domain